MFIFGTLGFRAALLQALHVISFAQSVYNASVTRYPHEKPAATKPPQKKKPYIQPSIPPRNVIKRARSPHGGLAVLRQHERGGGKPRRPARRNGSR